VRPNAANRIEMAAHGLLGSTAPGREAVLICMAVAYDAGRDIASARFGWHVSQLGAALDLRNPTSECGAAIGRAQHVSAVAGFTGDDMMATIWRSHTWFEAEVLFEVSGRGVSPFLGLR
jgi:hypothetical protein